MAASKIEPRRLNEFELWEAVTYCHTRWIRVHIAALEAEITQKDALLKSCGGSEIVDEFEWYQQSKKQLEARIAALEAEIVRKDAALKTAHALLDSKSRNADRIEEALRLAMQAKAEE